MAKYVVLLDWTDQGARTAATETIERVGRARAAWEPLGVRIEAFYWTLGAHDAVVIVEAQDDASLAAALLQAASWGAVHSKTLRAFDEGEMQTLLGKLG
jgi:uncharacterized protein with GYD domain